MTADLPEGASNSLAMPAGAVELRPDFVTFAIPGFDRGWGGPWPPDRQHRFVFTLYALKVSGVSLTRDADLSAFSVAVMPVVIEQVSFSTEVLCFLGPSWTNEKWRVPLAMMGLAAQASSLHCVGATALWLNAAKASGGIWFSDWFTIHPLQVAAVYFFARSMGKVAVGSF